VEVMIVDDSEDFRYLLRKRLESYGCVVVAEATNAREGLDLFRAKRPRLVTLDLMMPDAPEFVPHDLFRQIRLESPQTAIVIVSVQRANTNASIFLREGALAYWEKSFLNFDDVRRRLSHIFPDLNTPLLQTRSSLSQRVRGSLTTLPSQNLTT
jgi:two-component system, chemotaxis family, chemotaxis protein CheY